MHILNTYTGDVSKKIYQKTFIGKCIYKYSNVEVPKHILIGKWMVKMCCKDAKACFTWILKNRIHNIQQYEYLP